MWIYTGLQPIKEGGKADLLSNELQPGDEVVNINEVNLTSSRQKAIALVKSSCKTLKLVVRSIRFRGLVFMRTFVFGDRLEWQNEWLLLRFFDFVTLDVASLF
ncbi:Protein Shroom3 [Varanus komodoensis]|nr:Protein Shroom3 [Varanus komodoensis]